MTGMDLAMREADKRGPVLKNRFVGDAEIYKGLLDRDPLEQPMESIISGTRWDRTSSKQLRACSSGDFISSPEQKQETSRWSS